MGKRSDVGLIFEGLKVLESFVMRSRVDGIREAYRRTYEEITEYYAAAMERIAELEKQISEMEQAANVENTANAAIEKSLEQKKMMPGRKPKLLTEEEAAKAVRMRNAGMTYQKIASELGVSERTIRRVVATDPDLDPIGSNAGEIK